MNFEVGIQQEEKFKTANGFYKNVINMDADIEVDAQLQKFGTGKAQRTKPATQKDVDKNQEGNKEEVELSKDVKDYMSI